MLRSISRPVRGKFALGRHRNPWIPSSDCCALGGLLGEMRYITWLLLLMRVGRFWGRFPPRAFFRLGDRTSFWWMGVGCVWHSSHSPRQFFDRASQTKIFKFSRVL